MLVLLIIVAAIVLVCQCFSHITLLVLTTIFEIDPVKGLPKPLPTPFSFVSYSKEWPLSQQRWPYNPGLDNENVNDICLESSGKTLASWQKKAVSEETELALPLTPSLWLEHAGFDAQSWGSHLQP